MTGFKDTFQHYDSAYLLERRALGDQLSEEAHAAIEAILQERGEAVPPRPAQPVRVSAADAGRQSASFGKTVALLLVAVAVMVVAKMVAHMWVGILISAVVVLYYAVDRIRRRSLTPAQREAEQQAKLAEEDGLTELMRCAADGDTTRVKDLLNFGAPVNAKSLRGTTALMYAARNSHLDIAKALIIAGANVNARSDANATALSIATRYGHQQMADYLRHQGANERHDS